MQEKPKKPKTMARRIGESVDGIVEVFSPRSAVRRKQYRFAYDILDGGRTRKKRRGRQTGTGDVQLDQRSHSGLMEISRDLSRNNPLAVGILKTERDGVIGIGPKPEAATSDKDLNTEIDMLWQEHMVDQTIDNTRRFNWPAYIRKKYLSYRRDGDASTIFGRDTLRPIEADQIGTPYNQSVAIHSKVINGVAYSKIDGHLVGYYIGTPDKWGYIQPLSVKKVAAENVHMMFDPDRFSQSRGAPALTPSIDYIDKISDYFDAELIAAKVQACFCVFIAKKDEMTEDGLSGYTGGVSSSGLSDTDRTLEKIEPGMIKHGEVGESATPLGMNRPGGMFDPFMNKALVMIGRPINMPLMLVTLDFSGATFMNAKIAYDRVKEHWKGEQSIVVKPFVSKVYRWFIDRMIRMGLINNPPADIYRHRVSMNRWPYVDPFKQAKADEVELKTGVTSEIAICEQVGTDYRDVIDQRVKAKEIRAKAGINEPEWATPKETVPVIEPVKKGTKANE